MATRKDDLLEPRTVSSTKENSSPHAIADIRHRIADIDAEIANLRARLVRLAAERKPLVQALESIVYPVVTLPAEITAEIFLQYFTRADIGGTDPNIPHGPGWIPPCGPLLLASVCRAWREIALHLQPIWSKFHLVPTQNAIPSTEKLLQCWLPRTGNHPLEVDIGRWGISALCASLAPFFHQLQFLSCSVDTPDTLPADLFRGRIPLLRRLDITVIDDLPFAPITAFADAPQLREVVLGDLSLPCITLPWGQLTLLHFYGQNITQCAEILHQTSRLETLVVDYVSPDATQLSPVRLEHLHTLKFHQLQPDINLIDHLTLPALKHFEFPMPPMPRHTLLENSAVQQFTTFIARSACSLCSITIMAPADFQATTACLRAAPTLATVRMKDIQWGIGAFLQVLRKPDFLPNVRSLSLNPCRHVMEIPYDDLAASLASRRQERGEGTSRLQSFELVMAGNADWEPTPTVAELEYGLEALRALEADGLKVNIRNLQKLTPNVDAIAVYPPRAELL
ncbi:hypothetical protein DFH06DRAFT_141710 [Mycena polygramma]|nr:hypothetical protein DFH06DRAFT_141710 [Mycena polygramma]